MKSKKIDKSIILFLFPIMIIFGKIVRWTLMKTVLVDAGIGHSFLTTILYGSPAFSIFSVDSTSEANENAVFIFSFIYKILGINTYLSYEVAISIIWNIILFVLVGKTKKSFNIFESIFLLMSIAILNIFDFCLAKEPIQMLYFILIYIVLRSRLSDTQKKWLSYGVILLSVLTYRTYYILVLFFAILIELLLNKFVIKQDKVKIKDILKILIVLGVSYFILLNICKVASIDNYNELLRVRLRTSTAASDMRSLFGSNNLIIFTLDYLIMLIRMLLPIELLRLGAKYFLYVIYQLIVTIFTCKSIINIKHNTKSQNIALFIYLGFLFASATFEPDFGSWVRHEAVTFPIMLIMFGLCKSKGREDVVDERRNKKII